MLKSRQAPAASLGSDIMGLERLRACPGWRRVVASGTAGPSFTPLCTTGISFRSKPVFKKKKKKENDSGEYLCVRDASPWK